jgi:hypothetical protein
MTYLRPLRFLVLKGGLAHLANSLRLRIAGAAHQLDVMNRSVGAEMAGDGEIVDSPNGGYLFHFATLRLLHAGYFPCPVRTRRIPSTACKAQKQNSDFTVSINNFFCIGRNFFFHRDYRSLFNAKKRERQPYIAPIFSAVGTCEPRHRLSCIMKRNCLWSQLCGARLSPT